MKTRNGFVSNSSSSSFVVGFPHEPQSEKDVMKIIFHDKEGGINPWSHTNGLSHSQIAYWVWQDFKNKNIEKATLEDIINVFKSRYYYVYEPHWGQSIFSSNYGKADGPGYWAVNRYEKYFGTDQVTLEKLKNIKIQTNKKEQEIRNRQNEIRKACPIKKVPPAYESGNYIKKQINDYNAYRDKLKQWLDNHDEYQRLERKYFEVAFAQHKEKKIEKLRTKLAEADTKKLLEDNPNSLFFITEYSDNEGETRAIMEHGNIFKNLPHVVINNH
ncbi:MAG: hypothetical protein ACOCWG_06205 [bacterium]